MITDNVEALYRQKLMPKLCAVNPDRPFTQEVKVYMVNKNSPQLLQAVNRWLSNHR